MKKFLIITSIALFPLAAAAQVFNGGTIPQLNPFTSTTSPTTAITQSVYGRPIKITGLSTGSCLTLTSGNLLSTTTCSGSPAGSNTQLQYNNSGSFGGANLYYDSNSLGIGVSLPQYKLDVNGTTHSTGNVQFDSNLDVGVGSGGGGVGKILIHDSGAGTPISISGDSAVPTYFNAGNFGLGSTTPGTLFSLGNTGANTINISPTATSTFGSGLNLRTGCFAVNGTCVGGGSLSTPVSIANGGTAATTKVAAAQNVGMYQFADNGSGNQNGSTTAPQYAGQMGVNVYETNIPGYFFSNSTATGGFNKGAVFPAGIQEIGDQTQMDANISHLRINANGNAAASTTGGDAELLFVNWSHSPYASGSDICTDVTAVTNPLTNPVTVENFQGNVSSCFQHVNNNAVAGDMPGTTISVFNYDKDHQKSYWISGTGQPASGSSGLSAGNYSLAGFDWQNGYFRVPLWTSGVYQPTDTDYAFTVTGMVTPPAVTDMYTVGGHAYSVNAVNVGAGIINATGTSSPPASGTLTYLDSFGAHADLTLTYTSVATSNTWRDTFTARASTGAINFSRITGSTQCLHVDTNGLLSGTGTDCPATIVGTPGQTLTYNNSSVLIATSTFFIGGDDNISMGNNAGSPGSALNISSSHLPVTVGINRGDVSGAPTTLDYAGTYLDIGEGEAGLNSYRLIGFGYHNSSATGLPAFIGFKETNHAGYTLGDLVFGARNVTTDSNPSELMRITSAGKVGIGTTSPYAVLSVVGATTPVFAIATSTVSNSSTPIFEVDPNGHQITSGPTPSVSGGTSSVVGNDNNGTITVTGTLLTSVTLTFASAWGTAPDCTMADSSTGVTGAITSISTTQMVVGFSAGVNSGTVWYVCRGHQ